MRVLSKLASEIAKREGKKSQARIGDIREIIGILSDIFYEDETCDLLNAFHEAGAKRAKKRK
jgi:hypothetical protein